jgi:hypothetical protein
MISRSIPVAKMVLLHKTNAAKIGKMVFLISLTNRKGSKTTEMFCRELQIETKVDKCGKIDKIVLSSGKSRQNRQNAAKSTKSFCRAAKCDKIDKSKDKARQFLSSLDIFYLDGRLRQKLKNLDSFYLAMSTVGNCRQK